MYNKNTEYYASLSDKLLFEMLIELKQTANMNLTFKESLEHLMKKHNDLSVKELKELKKQYICVNHILDSFIKRSFVKSSKRIDFFVEKGTDRISSVVYN